MTSHIPDDQLKRIVWKCNQDGMFLPCCQRLETALGKLRDLYEEELSRASAMKDIMKNTADMLLADERRHMAEIARLRAENERLRAKADATRDAVKQIRPLPPRRTDDEIEALKGIVRRA